MVNYTPFCCTMRLALISFSLATCIIVSDSLTTSPFNKRVTTVSNIPHTAYLSLRTCVANASHKGVTACFAAAGPSTAPPSTHLIKGSPPIIVVPDCEESVLQTCKSDKCIPLFAATTKTIPSSATLLRTRVLNSAFAVEAARPSRQVPGGPYTTFVNALLRAGYTNGDTLRAAAWDWRVRGAARSASAKVSLMLANADGVLLVARGAGCALAARAIKGTIRVRALLCIGAAPATDADFSPYESELGLRERRRGRPLPVVAGPWGDGKTPVDCAANAGVDAVPVARIAHVPVRCTGDCERWLPGARSVECGEEKAMVTEVECLLGDLR